MFATLRARLGVLFAAFLLLVTASVAVTFTAVESQRNDALLINLAGRQRMLSQQLTWLALAAPESTLLASARQRFADTLTALMDGGTALDASGQMVTLPKTDDPAVQIGLAEVREAWLRFEALLPNGSPFVNAQSTDVLAASSLQLVDALDRVVAQLAQHAQAKVDRLRAIQIGFLAAALALLGVAYWLTRRRVVDPLADLSVSAQRMAEGNLEASVPTFHERELSQLASTLDAMRVEVLGGRRQLEARVNQRTQELTAAFEFSQEIASQLELTRLLASVTDRARSLMAGHAAALCLLDEESASLRLAAGSGAGEINRDLRQPIEAELPSLVISQGRTVTTASACSSCGFLRSLGDGQCVATPLRAGNDILGALCVTRPAQAAFAQEEQTALSLLANAAATAIINARLVETSNQQAHAAAAQAERERLAADLHDNLAQTLSFLNLKAERLEEVIVAGDEQEASRVLAQMRSAMAKAYSQVRAALTGLKTSGHEGDELVERLRSCVEEMQGVTNLPITLKIEEGQPLLLSPVAQQQALHIVREALTNVWRHAGPAQATVSVWGIDGAICIEVSDNGCGFDPNRVDERAHLGLTIMRARAERSGGSLTVRSQPGAGAVVTAIFPSPIQEGST